MAIFLENFSTKTFLGISHSSQGLRKMGQIEALSESAFECCTQFHMEVQLPFGSLRLTTRCSVV